MGAGQTHHFALAVPDEASQLEWRDKLVAAGLPVSPVMDRTYFKSIYTRDPDGHIVMALAESAEWRDDRTLEVRVREGARFQDGEPCTTRCTSARSSSDTT